MEKERKLEKVATASLIGGLFGLVKEGSLGGVITWGLAAALLYAGYRFIKPKKPEQVKS